MKTNNNSLGIKRLKIGSYGIAVTAIIIALVIIVNLIMSELPTTITHIGTDPVDFYDVGEVSQKVLDAVDTDITVYHIAQKGKEDTLLTELLTRYESLCSRIKVKTVDPAVNPGFVGKYTDETLSENSLIFESELRTKIVSFTELYTTEYTEEEQYYMMMGYSVSGTTYFNGELMITSAIDYVTKTDIPVVYSLTGHREESLDDTYSTKITGENIRVTELNLLSSSAVPDDCAILFINLPKSDISSDELEKINAYTAAGGDVLLITDFRDYDKESMPNLTAMAEKCGLTADTGLVVENDSNKYYGYQYVLIPTIVSSANGITANINTKSMNTLFNGAHAIMAMDETTATFTSILETSTKAVLMDVDDKGVLSEREGYKSGEAISIAAVADTAVAEGKFGDVSSLVWYGSASVVDSSMTNYIGEGNMTLFLATLNHLSEGTASISILGKSWSIEPLVLSEAQTTTWMVVMTIAVPLAILACGFVVWFRRRKR